MQNPVDDPLSHLHLPRFHDDDSVRVVAVERQEILAVLERERTALKDSDALSPLDWILRNRVAYCLELRLGRGYVS